MATINGYTAERMQEIEDSSIVDADIVGDDLVLTKFDGSTLNVGNVRGAPGISDMALYDPVGVPKPLAIETVPSGYGVCDAQTEYDGTTYPILAAEYDTGPSCINGVSSAGKFRLPDLRGKFLVGLHSGVAAFDTLHETGGSKDAVVVTHIHTADQPAHNHTADQASHDHGGVTAEGGVHTHSVDGGDFGDRIVVTYGTAGASFLDNTSGYNITYSHLDDSPTHHHDISAADPGITVDNADPAITVDSAGVSGTNANLPPYRVVKYIMRLA